MGGLNQCTLTHLSGAQYPVHADRLSLLSERTRRLERNDVYTRLAESMTRMDLAPHTVKPQLMPENLRTIVETAWAACTQDVSGDRVHLEQITSPFSNLRRSDSVHPTPASVPGVFSQSNTSDPTHLACRSLTSHNFAPRRTSLPCSSSSVIPVLSRCPSQASVTTIPWDMLRNRACLDLSTLKRRPLLRQRESYSPPIDRELAETDLGLFSNPGSASSSSSSSLPKPMQVHRRQVVPRKQDAIYNARYKTQPCLHFQKYKRCPLGDNCHFAHGPDELLHPQMHPKYRTRICLNFAQTGICPFGKQCYFLHAIPSFVSESQTAMSRPNLILRSNERHTVFGT